MAAIQNLVLADRASTPVNHTFVPAGFTDGVVRVRESASNGVPIGASEYTLGLRQTPAGTYKATTKLVIPRIVTEVINGVSKVTTLAPIIIEATFTYPQDTTTVDRNNAVGMFQASLSTDKVLVNDTIVNLNKAY